MNSIDHSNQISAGNMPSISAVIPVYNGKNYLREAVDSIANQTILPTELIIVDDGSTDDSLSSINQLTLPFKVRSVRQENGGQSQARNHGARLAKGEYLALLDQDDVWYPDHLERLLQPCLEDPDIGWTFGNLDQIDQFGNTIFRDCLDYLRPEHKRTSVVDFLDADVFIVPSASLIKTKAFLAVGGFDERLSGYEDDDLFLRLFMRGYRHCYIPKVVSQWRIHPQSCTHTLRMQQSCRKYAAKLIAAFPNDPQMQRWWVRDSIAPRFFDKAIHTYYLGLKLRDWVLCRQAHQDMKLYSRLMIMPWPLRSKLALMHFPRLFASLSTAVRQSSRASAYGGRGRHSVAVDPMDILQNAAIQATAAATAPHDQKRASGITRQLWSTPASKSASKSTSPTSLTNDRVIGVK